MEANIMIEALADAYKMAALERDAVVKELKTCQEEIERLKGVIVELKMEALDATSTADDEAPEETS
jgi:hypothetical protein